LKSGEVHGHRGDLRSARHLRGRRNSEGPETRPIEKETSWKSKGGYLNKRGGERGGRLINDGLKGVCLLFLMISAGQGGARWRMSLECLIIEQYGLMVLLSLSCCLVSLLSRFSLSLSLLSVQWRTITPHLRRWRESGQVRRWGN